MEFGELVTYLRRKADKTQAQLADEIPISPQYLNQIEKGRAVDSIGNHIIDKIGDILNISRDELSKYKSNLSGQSQNSSQSTIDSLQVQFDIERESWKTQVAMLKDIVKDREERLDELREEVKFLRSIVKS